MKTGTAVRETCVYSHKGAQFKTPLNPPIRQCCDGKLGPQDDERGQCVGQLFFLPLLLFFVVLRRYNKKLLAW